MTKTFYSVSAASADYAAEMKALTSFSHDEIISSLRLDAKKRKRCGRHILGHEGTDSEKESTAETEYRSCYRKKYSCYRYNSVQYAVLAVAARSKGSQNGA